jgi:PPOX class probable F420-dependent enzyme
VALPLSAALGQNDTMTAPVPNYVLRFFDAKLRMGYIATARPDGHLSVVPVGVMLHDGRVRISSPTDTFKVRNLRHDPHIAVCVPDAADPRRYLMIRGLAELADDTDKAFLNWLARTHMGLDDYSHESPEVLRTVITIKAERFIMAGTHGDG